MSSRSTAHAWPGRVVLFVIAALVVTSNRTAAQTAQSNNRAWFGFSISCSECSMTVTRGGTRWEFKLPPGIRELEPGGPAAAAGMRSGDLLLRIDGRLLTTEAGADRLASVRPGEAVRFTVQRGSETMDMLVTPGNFRETEVKEAVLGKIREVQSGHTVTVIEPRGRTDSLRLARIDTLRGRVRLQGDSVIIEPKRLAYSLRKTDSTTGKTFTVATVQESTLPLRFSGSFGDADITVRGGANTTVTMADRECWMEIRTADALVRLQLREGCRKTPR